MCNPSMVGKCVDMADGYLSVCIRCVVVIVVVISIDCNISFCWVDGCEGLADVSNEYFWEELISAPGELCSPGAFLCKKCKNSQKTG